MNNKTFQSIAFIYAIIVFAALLLAHIPVLLDKPALVEIPFGLGFAAIFPLWAYMIFYIKKNNNPKTETGENEGFIEKIKIMLGNPPQWVFTGVGLFYAYGLYCVYLWMTGGALDPVLVNGRYQINNHGNISFYTEAEYLVQHKKHLLSETGFLMLFSAVTVAVFWPKNPVQADSEFKQVM